MKASPVRQIEEVFDEFHESRCGTPKVKFTEYGPWMSMADRGFVWSLIRCAGSGERCSSEELDYLRTMLKRAVARKQAGEPPYSII